MRHDHEQVRELHRKGGGIIKDAVYAAHDGIITTFAIVAGVVGADLSSVVVLILGFANLFADGLSMAFGNYLGSVSEKHFIESERRAEKQEVETMPEIEREEIREIYRGKGFEGELLERVVDKITEDKKRWVDVMMREELELPDPTGINPIRNGVVTLFSFLVAGIMPLIPYLPFVGLENRFLAASLFAGLALFGIGAGRSLVTRVNPAWGGLEMLGVGSVAAVVAYGIGAVLRQFLLP